MHLSGRCGRSYTKNSCLISELLHKEYVSRRHLANDSGANESLNERCVYELLDTYLVESEWLSAPIGT